MVTVAAARNVLSVLVDVNDGLSPPQFLSCRSAQTKPRTQVAALGEQLICHKNSGGGGRPWTISAFLMRLVNTRQLCTVM